VLNAVPMPGMPVKVDPLPLKLVAVTIPVEFSDVAVTVAKVEIPVLTNPVAVA